MAGRAARSADGRNRPDLRTTPRARARSMSANNIGRKHAKRLGTLPLWKKPQQSQQAPGLISREAAEFRYLLSLQSENGAEDHDEAALRAYTFAATSWQRSRCSLRVT
jgi:hypothetical protein